ncbi:NfeD family protein [Kiritimatiella glycovorans]|uniref:Uncharacterized protein n=1 Tax=Kiritimatiella glycovorans TaxID=1307763 RepID=A0A0G3EHK7_9BACT|nr:nodulation protein NfeD [Kiritimatiella glycovorans]AKJ64902.1 hypothetical protein L21SP4_01659 [Kiritimatiella glycovorans]
MIRRLLFLLVFVLLVPAAGAQQDVPSEVWRVTIEDEAVTPGMERFVRRVLGEAEEAGAECLVIELDTPGGLLTSTRHIVQDITGSRVPVVVYVAPSGARAASAGLFITLSSHVAAMAPGTNIGAAHPVQLGPPGMPSPSPQKPGMPERPRPDEGDSPDEDGSAANGDGEADTNRPPAQSDIMTAKQVEDAKAWVRSLSKLRGRNAEWAQKAVAESKSASAEEALELGVIDLIAEDTESLLTRIDGMEVEAGGTTRTLATAGAPVRDVSRWWGEKLLAAISNPNIAFLLLMFGFYGILFEFYSPGWGVGGVVGVLCLLLGFYGLSILPVNYAGLALLIAAVALFTAEAFVPSFGALTIGGAVCLVLGGVMLIDSPQGFMKVSLKVIVPAAAATAGITLFLVGSIVKGHRRRPLTGDPGAAEQTVEARDDFQPHGGAYRGHVYWNGEWWSAVCETPVSAGQNVKIEKREGLTLYVKAP